MDSIYWIERLDRIHDLVQTTNLVLCMIFIVLLMWGIGSGEQRCLRRALRFGMRILVPAIIIGLLAKTFLPTTEEKYKELQEIECNNTTNN